MRIPRSTGAPFRISIIPSLSLPRQDNAGRITKGVTQIGHWQFNTTGLFGASYESGQLTARGFPAWATLPGPQWLAMGRL